MNDTCSIIWQVNRLEKRTMSVPSCSTSKGLNNGATEEKVAYGKWERFSNWVHCICIVTFDLELGQAIEVRNPSEKLLS